MYKGAWWKSRYTVEERRCLTRLFAAMGGALKQWAARDEAPKVARRLLRGLERESEHPELWGELLR